jgi:hypothetical protein
MDYEKDKLDGLNLDKGVRVVVMYRVEIGKGGKLALFLSYHSHAKL